MTMVHIGLEVPKPTDEFFRTEVKQARKRGRVTSKSALMREVLVAHVEAKQGEPCEEQTPSAPSTSR